MSSSRMLRALVICTAALSGGAAHAEKFKAQQPFAYEAGTPTPAPDGPPPQVKFISPEALDIVPADPKTLPGQAGTKVQVQCAFDKGPEIKLDVKDWKMSPGGNGIRIVANNKVALTVYDTKPIPLTKLLPLPKGDDNAINGQCGWVSLAAFAITANGESVKTPGAVDQVPILIGHNPLSYPNVPEAVEKKAPILVVNFPMLGKPMNGEQHAGWRSDDPDKVVLDYLVFNAPPQGLKAAGVYAIVSDGSSHQQTFESQGPQYIRHMPPGSNRVHISLWGAPASWPGGEVEYWVYNVPAK